MKRQYKNYTFMQHEGKLYGLVLDKSLRPESTGSRLVIRAFDTPESVFKNEYGEITNRDELLTLARIYQDNCATPQQKSTDEALRDLFGEKLGILEQFVNREYRGNEQHD